MVNLKALSNGSYEGLAEMLAIVRPIGWEVSAILRAYYRGKQTSQALESADPSDGPVTAADLAVNHHILERLQMNLGTQEFGYLTEETYKTQTSRAAFPQPWVWIIDPLDGTRDFIEKTGEYAVHIALTHQNRPILSVVALPEQEKVYYATLGGGAFVETSDGATRVLQVSKRDRPEDLTAVVSRTHRDQRFDQLLSQLPLEKRLFVGSVGCKVVAIIEHLADVYISLSGKSAPKDWDMAAPELILTEAGGKFTHFDGSPLRYNTGDVSQWGGLMASNGACHPLLCTEAEKILADIDAAKV
ncbi:MAG: 3'(2'),5'-bisphosphate nucleotidase CysQ [Scytolyngbya sp. HA4215-MV1]|nr:3'(2'),5'-bisphosphate nucleotidase CysQ [Scytolyngbya sp. HA4215-MV1]